MTHGTVSTYTNHRCRCDRCREAKRVYAAALRARQGGDIYQQSLRLLRDRHRAEFDEIYIQRLREVRLREAQL